MLGRARAVCRRLLRALIDGLAGPAHTHVHGSRRLDRVACRRGFRPDRLDHAEPVGSVREIDGWQRATARCWLSLDVDNLVRRVVADAPTITCHHVAVQIIRVGRTAVHTTNCVRPTSGSATRVRKALLTFLRQVANVVIGEALGRLVAFRSHSRRGHAVEDVVLEGFGRVRHVCRLRPRPTAQVSGFVEGVVPLLNHLVVVRNRRRGGAEQPPRRWVARGHGLDAVSREFVYHLPRGVGRLGRPVHLIVRRIGNGLQEPEARIVVGHCEARSTHLRISDPRLPSVRVVVLVGSGEGLAIDTFVYPDQLAELRVDVRPASPVARRLRRVRNRTGSLQIWVWSTHHRR